MNETTSSFETLATPHRRAIHLHRYRMVGSFAEADDLVQETLLRAWNARATFEARGAELHIRGDRIQEITTFQTTLLHAFNLPEVLA